MEIFGWEKKPRLAKRIQCEEGRDEIKYNANIQLHWGRQPYLNDVETPFNNNSFTSESSQFCEFGDQKSFKLEYFSSNPDYLYLQSTLDRMSRC